MAKYKEFGKKILAVLMTLAVVLTASSVDIEALAAALGGLGNQSGFVVNSGGGIGQVVTVPTESDNQRVDKVSFDIEQVANQYYGYTCTLYENPTDASDLNNPVKDRGVKRKTINGEFTATEAGKKTVEISVPHEESEDPIVLTPGESLVVVIDLSSRTNCYGSDSGGNGFIKRNSGESWSLTGNIISVTTSEYNYSIKDVTKVTMNPSKKALAVGEKIPLNGSVEPKYKRNITYTDENDILKFTKDEAGAAYAEGKASGETTVRAQSCGINSEAMTIYVLQATVNEGEYEYTGAPIEPTVEELKCGSTTLVRDTDYELSCTDNTNLGTAHYTITGIGKYSGYTKSGTYTITKGLITETMVSGGTYIIDTNTDTLTSATLKDSDATLGTDFVATIERKSTTLTSIKYEITVTGIGNYTGTQTTTKDITPSSESKIDINSVLNAKLKTDKDKYDYDGSQHKPGKDDITFTYKDGSSPDPAFTAYTLSYSGDYTNVTSTKPKVIITPTDSKFTGTIELEYSIKPRSIGDTTITLDPNPNYYIHTGEEKKPPVTVTYNDDTKDLGTDYTLLYSNNVDIGQATVTITGKGNFTGSTTQTFNIIPDFINDATISLAGYETNHTTNFVTAYKVNYNGKQQKPTVNWLRLGETELTENVDYSVDYSLNTDVGTGEVKITGLGTYASETNKFTVKFTIEPKALTGSVSMSQQAHQYSGDPITLGTNEYSVYDGSTKLTKDKDYTIDYENNINAGTATIKATGIGNYKGDITGTFTISPFVINDDNITVEGIVNKGYTGNPQTQDNLVVKLNGKTLTKDTDYTLSYKDNTNVGTATVTITGAGNLTGSADREFEITPKSMTTLTYTVGGKPCRDQGDYLQADFVGYYTGEQVIPEVVVKDGDTVVDSSNYTLQPINAINVGTAYINVIGKGAYQKSSVQIRYEIKKISIDDATIEWDGTSRVDTDDKIRPNVTVKVPDTMAASGYRVLKENTDYEIKSTVTAAGPNLQATVEGINNYEGSQIVNYSRGFDIATVGREYLYYPGTDTAITKDSSGDYTYSYIGKQHPKINVRNKAGGEISGIDYNYNVLSGDGYKAESVVTVTAEAVNNVDYYGKMTFSYRVAKKDLSEYIPGLPDSNISVTDGNNLTNPWIYDYDSKTKTVNPILTYNLLPEGARDLVKDTDFTVSEDTVGPDVVASKEVTITGKDNYKGTKTISYKINACDMGDNNKVRVSDISSQDYTGSAIEPDIVAELWDGTEWRRISTKSGYTVEYENNTNPGPATVTLTGTKNFTGTRNTTFTIKKATIDQNIKCDKIPDVMYDGNDQTPLPSNVMYNNRPLTLGVDYEVFYHDTNKVGIGTVDSAGNHSGPCVEIRAKDTGPYEGKAFIPFTIRGEINDSNLFEIGSLEDKYYINSEYDIDVSGFSVKYKKDGTLLPSAYWELKKPSTIAPGKENLTIVGLGPMDGEVRKEVSLIGSLEQVTIEGLEQEYSYTGSDINLDLRVYFGTKKLREGTDYTITHSSEEGYLKNVGKKKITIEPAKTEAQGGFIKDGTSQDSDDFYIKYNLNEAEITLPSDTDFNYVYNGEPKEPHPPVDGVKVRNHPLTEGDDYEVGWSYNVNAGTATMTVTAKEGSPNTKSGTFKSKQFTIEKASLADATVTYGTYPFNWTEQKPAPVVTLIGFTDPLRAGVDYVIEGYPSDTTSAGDKPVTIKGIGNFKDSKVSQYTIDAVSLASDTVTPFVSDALYAGGDKVTPEHSIMYLNRTLTENVDYKIRYNTDPRNLGDYTIYFDGMTKEEGGSGNFIGTISRDFKVVETDLNNSKVSMLNTSSEYTGAPIVADVEVTIDKGDGTSRTLVKGQDYTITYNDGQDMVNAGPYTVKIEAVPDSGYKGIKTEIYTVTPRSLNGANIHIEYNPDQEYTGQPVEPVVSITDDTREDSPVPVVLTQGQDYTVTYANNVNAAPATATNPPTIIITGKGNYADPETGAVNKAFNIGHPLGGLEIVLDSYQYTYDGQLHQPEAQVKRGDTILTEGVDYEKSYSNDDGSSLNANAGGKLVTITGKGGYYQFTSRQYDIVPKVANANKIKIEPNLLKDESGNYYSVYTGADIEPSVTIYDEEISSAIPVDPSNYDVAYVRNKDMSTPTNPALIKIVFKNNYAMGAESYTMPFYIKAKTIETGFEAYLPGGSQYAYTGNEVEPEVIVKPTSLDTVEGELIEGVDYTLTYINNVNAGTASVVVTGINNYSGEVVLPYNVVANLNDSTIIAPDQFYTGTEVHAPLTITCGGNTLVEGIDYAVTYTSDDNWQTRGTATVTSLQPYYAGTVTKDYNILFDPTILKVVGYANEYAFTGGPIKPDFKIVTPDGQEIPYNPEDITYYNSSTGFGDCTSIGTVTATIPLNIGDKACELKAVYDIIGRNINLCNIVPLYDNVYTGNKLYPPVIIRNEQGDLLTEGVDYTLEYSNNIYPGVGKIVITGKGNYIASVTKYFNIIAPNMLGLTAAPEGDNAVKLSWLRNARITGYEIYSGDCSVKYGSTSDTTFTVTGLKQATDYEFKVRTYITANGRTSYGEFKSVTGHSGMAKPEITVQSLARQRATINWTSAGNVTGYEIYRGSSATGTFSKIAVMPSSAGGYSDSNLVSGGTYYYKVRAYYKVGENQFVYGYFSDPKAVTIR